MANTTHTLELLVEETSVELASVEGELAQVREHVTALEKKADVLRAEKASFLAALQRRVPAMVTQAPTEEQEQSADDWRSMPRTDAVLKALAAVEPAGPAEVQKYLSEAGRDDGRDLVSAALAHLKRSGRAWRGGYSKWSTKPFPLNAEGPASTGPSDDVASMDRGGGISHAQIDQDHGESLTGRNRDHRSGASVAEVQF